MPARIPFLPQFPTFYFVATFLCLCANCEAFGPGAMDKLGQMILSILLTLTFSFVGALVCCLRAFRRNQVSLILVSVAGAMGGLVAGTILATFLIPKRPEMIPDIILGWLFSFTVPSALIGIAVGSLASFIRRWRTKKHQSDQAARQAQHPPLIEPR